MHCSLSSSICIGVPINADIYCSITVVYQIENGLNECAVQSWCIIHCKGSIAIGVPINADMPQEHCHVSN